MIGDSLDRILLNASLGDKESQYSLGKKFESGDGVDQSFEAAIFWYILASDSGSDVAKYEIARFYECGLGVDESMTTAIRWYRESAESGNIDSQLKIGEMYEHGDGVEQSLEEAALWYRKAADNGNATAQLNLGYLFEWGRGVEQSFEKAKHWFQKALKSGNGRAAVALQSINKKIEKCTSPDTNDNLSPISNNEPETVEDVQIISEESNVLQNLLDLANDGDVDAQFKLGLLYETGKLVDQNLDEAVAWFRKAHINGSTDAEKRLIELGYLPVSEPENIKVNEEYGFDSDEIRDAQEKVEEIRKIMNLDELYEEDEKGEEEKPVLEKGWGGFIKMLKPIQMDYLRCRLNGLEWNNPDYDPLLVEDSVNELSSDTIGDIILENGDIVEYYVEKLKEVL